MYENFLALEHEKRNRIINAAMEEFTIRGFRNASTNEIVKKAGISKGALFHYFASKHELFAFLYDYSIDVFMGHLSGYMNDMPADVFERWSAFAILKVEVGARHPRLYNFIVNAIKDEDGGVRALMADKQRQMTSEFLRGINSGIDTSRFRKDVDVRKALKAIWWVLEGFTAEKQAELVSGADAGDGVFIRSAVDDMETYLGLLRKALYAEG